MFVAIPLNCVLEKRQPLIGCNLKSEIQFTAAAAALLNPPKAIII